jgi:predicted pyridoxine 5'-phosphate oxidase superfamily flavin-nucleotide-binding protein
MSEPAADPATRFRRLDREAMRAVLGHPEPSTEAKVVPTIGETARRFVAHSPFACLATSDAHGRADCSPRRP